MADDEGQGLVEFDDNLVIGAEGPNALDKHLRREINEVSILAQK